MSSLRHLFVRYVNMYVLTHVSSIVGRSKTKLVCAKRKCSLKNLLPLNKSKRLASKEVELLRKTKQRHFIY